MKSESPFAPGRVGVGAREEGQHVGAAGEGAPRLRAVDQPARLPAGVSAHGAALHGGDVAPHVRLGDRHAHHHLVRTRASAARDCFCASVPPWRSALVRISGRVIKRAGAGERGARQLLGGEDHREVPELVAAVLLRDREPEVAELAHRRDERLRDVLVVAVDAFGVRQHLLLARTRAPRRAPARASRRGAARCARAPRWQSDRSRARAPRATRRGGALAAAPGRPARRSRRRARARRPRSRVACAGSRPDPPRRPPRWPRVARRRSSRRARALPRLRAAPSLHRPRARSPPGVRRSLRRSA